MRQIFIPWIGSVVSVVGFAWTVWPNEFTQLQIALVTATTLVFLVSLALDVKAHLSRRPKRYRNSEDIVAYMHRWIAGGGRAVIFSRDMSWAADKGIKKLLLLKAKRSELTLCLPQETELSRDLATAGADVVAYSALGYVPASRFTIVNDGRMDARVAIGRQLDGAHVIEEFSLGEHPVFTVAQDLVEFARRISNEANRAAPHVSQTNRG